MWFCRFGVVGEKRNSVYLNVVTLDTLIVGLAVIGVIGIAVIIFVNSDIVSIIDVEPCRTPCPNNKVKPSTKNRNRASLTTRDLRSSLNAFGPWPWLISPKAPCTFIVDT